MLYVVKTTASSAIDKDCHVWYYLVMLSTSVYTPDQVADLLQLSSNTVYGLISRGEILAKKIGKVYRIPAKSISFVFTGLDFDLYQAELEDKKGLSKVQDALDLARTEL